MKFKHGLIAFFCGIALLGSGCDDAEEKKDNNSENNTEIVIDSEQTKLDVIQPMAYGNVNGLDLQPGTLISIIGRGSKTAYWNAVNAGAQKAAADINERLGYSGDDKVKVIYSAPEEEGNVDEQVNILDEELARYPAAIGIAVVDMTACAIQFDLAMENSIPIVAFDAGTDYQNILSLVKTDDKEAAKMAAKKLCDMIEDEGEILIVAHDTNSMTAQDRENAFTQQIKKKYERVDIVDVYHLDELPDYQREAAKAAEDSDEDEKQKELTHTDAVSEILAEHPEVKAIYTTSESAAVVVENTLKALELEDMIVVSFDGGESQIKRLKEGTLSGLVVQNPFGMGYATVVAAARAVLGQGNEAVVDTGYTWVTESNLEDATIQNMMY